jgi:predicted RNA-binding protein YlxR (DUF448 family)
MGVGNSKTEVMRRCIQTGIQAEKTQLVRFVRTPDGMVIGDLSQKLPGRGAYLSPEKPVIEKALKSGKLAHHLRKNAGEVQLHPEQLLTQLASQVTKQLLSHLTLLRRAGRLVTGRMKIEELDVPAALLIASDASRRETQSLISKTAPIWVETGLPSEMLGQIAGRDSLAYAAIILPEHSFYPDEIQPDEIEANEIHADKIQADAGKEDRLVTSCRRSLRLWRSLAEA